MVNQNSTDLLRETFAFMPKATGQTHVAAIALG
jgi:hypothetical protein